MKQKSDKLFTILFSFQIANVHPPTVRMISLKNGDLSKVFIGPSCASKITSGLGAARDKQNVECRK